MTTATELHPVPWTLTQSEQHPFPYTLWDANGEEISSFRLFAHSTSDTRESANARPGNAGLHEAVRLFAAAKQMCEALQRILSAWQSVGDDVQVPDAINVDEIWTDAQAALDVADPVPNIFD